MVDCNENALAFAANADSVTLTEGQGDPIYPSYPDLRLTDEALAAKRIVAFTENFKSKWSQCQEGLELSKDPRAMLAMYHEVTNRYLRGPNNAHLVSSILLGYMGRIVHDNSKKTGDYAEYGYFLEAVKNSAHPFAGYLYWAYPKQIDFMKTIASDPTLVDAKNRWSTFSPEDKLKVAEHVHAIQARMFGFTPDTIKLGTLPSNVDGEHVKGKITLNSVNDLITTYPFEKLLSIIVHEGVHTFNAALVARTKEIEVMEREVLKEMGLNGYSDVAALSGKRLEFRNRVQDKINASKVTPWDHALGFSREFSRYVEMLRLPYVGASADFKSYKNHPDEVDAFSLDALIGVYLTGDMSRRKSIEQRLQAAAESDMVYAKIINIFEGTQVSMPLTSAPIVADISPTLH